MVVKQPEGDINFFGKVQITGNDHDHGGGRGWSHKEDLRKGKMFGWSASPTQENGSISGGSEKWPCWLLCGYNGTGAGPRFIAGHETIMMVSI